MKIFLDTNVLLDVLLRRNLFYTASAAVWTYVESGRHEGWVSAISFNNAHYLLRKSTGELAARQALVKIRQLFLVVPLDDSILEASLVSPVKDFEDAIQWSSSQRIGPDYVITRNQSHFPSDGPPVIAPDLFLSIDSLNG